MDSIMKTHHIVLPLLLVSSVCFAEDTLPVVPTVPAVPVADTAAPTAETTTAVTPTPVAETPTPVADPANPPVEATTVTPTPVAPAPTPQVVNCDYKLADDATVDQPLLSTWAERAAVQSFTFKPSDLETELTALQKCYTGPGWKAFNEALKTSGNLEAIRSNNLTVSSEISGTAKVDNVKDNQWKVSVPLKVTYQNQEKQLLQALDVDLLIAREKSGKLGIMQVIAVPKP